MKHILFFTAFTLGWTMIAGPGLYAALEGAFAAFRQGYNVYGIWILISTGSTALICTHYMARMLASILNQIKL